MTRLLFVSAHSILEFDELKLFHELGISVFSHGAYVDPRDNSGDPKRPPLDIPHYPELCAIARGCAKEELDGRLIEWADVVLFMGVVEWIEANAARMHNKRVIWRSIGQAVEHNEQQLRELRRQLPGLVLVRYSPLERRTPGFAGEDALIRFYKDENEFCGWTGEDLRIISVGQMVKRRDAHCGLTWYERATEGLPRMMIGPHNEDITTMPNALLSYDELKGALRRNRAFFYTGTYPAPYTLGFIEAWITGIPVVAIGPRLRNANASGAVGLYEIPELITNGVNGYWSDDLTVLHSYCRNLLRDSNFAREMGQRGRETAIPLFGKQAAVTGWRAVLS